MVFYIAPKSKRLLSKPLENKLLEGKASLGAIAEETILQIVEDLSTSDVLNLRLVCSNVVPACTTILQGRLRTLYIHPSVGSIRKTIEICAHPVFSQEIEEVVLLGKAQWREIEKAYPRYRQHGSPRHMQDANKTKNHDYSLLPEWQSRFRPWPLVFSPNTKTWLREYCSTDAVQDTPSFEDAYELLTTSLSQLPKLSILSFAENVKKPGFNQVSQDAIEARANQCAMISKSAEGFRGKKGKGDISGLMQPTVRRADAEVLYGLFLSKRLNFTSLRLRTELPFVEDMLKGCREDAKDLSNSHFASLCFLTTLDLHLDCGWDPNQFHRLYQGLIRLSRVTLKNLRFCFVPNASMKQAETEITLASIFEELDLPNLETLELGLDPPPCGSTLAVQNLRHTRPSCQSFDIVSFVGRHLRTLTTIRFKNIIFADYDCNSDLPHFLDPPEVTRNVLQLLEEKSNKLQHFEWIVNHFHHDPRCKHADSEPTTDCRKLACGYYNKQGGSFSTLEQFEMLAIDFDVPLCSETRTWDFGSYVMRVLQARRQSDVVEEVWGRTTGAKACPNAL